MSLTNPRELLVLGLLRSEAMSAYALDRAVKMHGPLYGTFARGNVYELLAQLERTRAVSSVKQPASRGPRPTKSVFALTALGRRRYDAMLSSAIVDPQEDDATFEVACVLANELPPERARALFDKRLAALLAHEQRLERIFGNPKPRGGAALAMHHARLRLRAELSFVRECVRRWSQRARR